MKQVLINYIACIILFCILCVFIPKGLFAEIISQEELLHESKTKIFLKASPRKGIKLFGNGLLLSPSIGGRFFFFQRKIDGGRKNILTGPGFGAKYNHNFKKTSSGYDVSGIDPRTEGEFHISYRQKSDTELRLSLKFRVPQNANHLSFEILTIPADFFLGHTMKVTPESSLDILKIPVQPSDLDKRTLFKRKNKVRIVGPFFDIEVEDVSHSRFLNLADFRQVRWAKFKGLYLYTTNSFLKNGNVYSFDFSIRIFPKSESVEIQNENQSMIGKMPIEKQNFFDIPPKNKLTKNGKYLLGNGEKIYGNPAGKAENILRKGLASYKITVEAIKPIIRNIDGHKGIFVETGSCKNLLPSEGFQISIDMDKIEICGADERGTLFGVRSLLSSIKVKDSEKYLSCGDVKDWPDLPYRGACLSSGFIPVPSLKKIELFKRYLDAISISRGNTVIFYHRPSEVASWLDGRIDKRFWSKEEMKQLAEYARSLKLNVWAGMSAKFKKKDFVEMNIAEGSNFYDPLNKDSYRVLFDLYKEVIKLYKPSHFFIGHDEIKGLNTYATRYNKKPDELFSHDVKEIYNWLKNQNIRSVMAGDMLLDSNASEKSFEPANSQNNILDSGATHLSINDIPEDIMILDWHYSLRDSYASIDYFVNKGFQTIGASYHSPTAGHSLASSVKKNGGKGVFAMNFGFWRTLSPASTTLYTILCGWSDSLVPPLNNDIAAFASLLRPCGKEIWKEQYPLRFVANNTTYDNVQGDGKGFLDLGPILDLRKLPEQAMMQGSIEFDVVDSQKGRTNNCFILNNQKDVNPQTLIEFDSNKHNVFDAFAFLHTSFTDEPQCNLQSIGKYIIEYVDEEEVSFEIISGWNITDIRSNPGVRKNNWPFFRAPDLLIGSKIAWRGLTLGRIPINVQKFIVKNPFPQKGIKKIMIQLDAQEAVYTFVFLGATGLKE